MNKRIFLLAGLNILMISLIAVLWVKYNYKKNKICKNCNVILISLDTLAASHMPCYGYERNTMPNLCAFAKENIFFENSYSESFWTLPSHMSIFTSLYPTTHKVLRGLIDSLNPKYKTIAEILKDNNYITQYIGPTKDNAMPLDKGIGSGFDDIAEQNEIENWDKGIQLLEENQKSNKKTFLFLHTYKMHYPYFPEKKDTYQFVDMSIRNPEIPMKKEEYIKADTNFVIYATNNIKERIKTAKTKESLEIDNLLLNYLESDKTVAEKIDYFNEIDSTILYEQWQNGKIKNDSDLKFYTSLYDEVAFDLDVFLKGFLDELKQKNIDKNTIIVITSDHGEGFGEHGFLTHCGNYPDCLYNEIIRVPLIMSIPGVKNREIKSIVQGIDIYPTILSFLGIKPPEYIEGLNLRGMIENNFFQKKNKNIIAEHTFNQKAVVGKKWKLYIKNMNDSLNPESTVLFNLNNDKEEKNDLSKTKTRRVLIMKDYLKRFLKRPEGQWIDPSTKNIPDWLDETRKKRLLENGYF